MYNICTVKSTFATHRTDTLANENVLWSLIWTLKTHLLLLQRGQDCTQTNTGKYVAKLARCQLITSSI